MSDITANYELGGHRVYRGEEPIGWICQTMNDKYVYQIGKEPFSERKFNSVEEAVEAIEAVYR